MNTLADIVAFNREHASRHLNKTDRTWWALGVLMALCFVLSVLGMRVSSPRAAAQHMNQLAPTVNTR